MSRHRLSTDHASLRVGGAILLTLFLLLTALPVAAQEVSASITGVVTDPSGAAIVNASVNARDIDRGTSWPTTTNESGVYFFPRVPPGRYELRFEAQGFKTTTRPDVTLEVNQRARLNIALEIGQVTDSVQVLGEAPLLQTDTTIVGSTITSNNLSNAPIRSRNYIALTLLAPGVTTTNPADFLNDRRTSGGGRPYVNGNRKEANNFLLDGIDNNQVSDNLTSYQPNLDAIGEVKMITNNASAEFGNFQGGVVNVTMKSGTNQLHGSWFHFFRNDKLNANAWARNWTIGADGQSVPRVPVRYNSFGGTLGGPVVIPKVINGKDKLFFFIDYMGMRRPTPATITTPTVMPAAWRNGDFSLLLNPSAHPDLAGRQPLQLYNPFSLDASGRRQPFPNNQIPLSLQSPVARALFADTRWDERASLPRQPRYAAGVESLRTLSRESARRTSPCGSIPALPLVPPPRPPSRRSPSASISAIRNCTGAPSTGPAPSPVAANSASPAPNCSGTSAPSHRPASPWRWAVSPPGSPICWTASATRSSSPTPAN